MSKSNHLSGSIRFSSDSASPGQQRSLRPIASAKKTLSRLRFRLVDLMWLATLCAVLILWYQDHRSLSDRIASVNQNTNWSTNQVLGPPDTPSAGDHWSAWASREQDSGQEWLIVEFPVAVLATQFPIEETYNPGAVTRVCSVDFKGLETELWKGTDPTRVGTGMGSSLIPFSDSIRSRRFKIYLDSAGVSGWNEIDAVALHSDEGSIQWASDAWASSSFGTNQTLPLLFWP